MHFVVGGICGKRGSLHRCMTRPEFFYVQYAIKRPQSWLTCSVACYSVVQYLKNLNKFFFQLEDPFTVMIVGCMKTRHYDYWLPLVKPQ